MQENSVEETSPEKYCVCGHEDGNFMIECTAQNPKCNGWIHPSCFNLSENEIQVILKMDNYVCPLDRDEIMDKEYQDFINSQINSTFSQPYPQDQGSAKSYSSQLSSNSSNESEVSFDFEESDSDDSDYGIQNKKRSRNKRSSFSPRKSGKSRYRHPWSDDESEESDSSDQASDSDYEAANGGGNRDEDDWFENEEDGSESSPRRSSAYASYSKKSRKLSLRQLKHKMYSEMDDEDEDEDNADTSDTEENTNESPTATASSEQSKIEKILGRRFLPEAFAQKDTFSHQESFPDDAFEYLVKWRNESYLHVSWVKVDEINQDNPPHGHGRLIRFIKQLPVDSNGMIIEYPPTTKMEEFFSPSYVTIEKVLASTDMISYNPEEYWQTTCRNIMNLMYKYRLGGELVAAPFFTMANNNNSNNGEENSVTTPIDLCMECTSGRRTLGTIRQRLWRTMEVGKKNSSMVEEDVENEDLLETPSTAPEEKLSASTTSIYHSYMEFDQDMQLMFSNAEQYYANEETEDVQNIRKKLNQLRNFYNDQMDSFVEDYNTILIESQKKQALEEGNDQKKEKKYLIKWEDMSYAYCTWEKEEELNDDIKISQYERRERIPLRKKNPMYIPGKTKLKDPSFRLPPFKGNKTLRPYQIEGYRWMANNYIQNKSSILADEMGLGKTIQVISLMQYIIKVLCVGNPILVIAPLSTLGFWKSEIESWTTLDVCLYHDILGGKDVRKKIQDYEWYYKYRSGRHIGQNIPDLYKFDVLITTYEIALTDYEDISTVPFSLLVVDEAQRLKGQQSKLQNALKKMKWSQCVLLTGTPLQNNMTELWTLLQFVAPRVMPPLPTFLEQYGNLENEEQVKSLQVILQEYILRRLKENVEDSIPRKEETIIDIELTTLQKAYYRAIYEHNRDFLTRGYFRDGHANTLVTSTQTRGPTLLNMEMELRKCCNHPFLLDGAEERETAGLGTNEMVQKLISSSGKMVLMDKLLAKLKSEGHRVLLFSQFTGMLDIIEKYLKFKQYSYERIDGSIRGNLREKAIQHFNEKESDVFIFLLSTRAGGVGITLTAADTVIIYDSDWNPQNDVQAQARCHRIGQKKNVRIYRLITKNTYETVMFEVASRKLGLEQAVMSSRKSTSNENLEVLLKEGAYAQLLEDNTEQSKTFCESNIDELLEKQSRIISYDHDSNNSTSLFTKTSFVSTSSDSKLDVHDPEFWNKVFGEDSHDTILTRLEDGTATRSKESKEKFLQELKEMSEEMIMLRLNGEVLPTWCDLLGGVLKQIQGMKQLFTEEQRNICYKLLQEIDKPRRKRKMIQPSSDYVFFEEDSEDGDKPKKSTNQNEEICYVCLKPGSVYLTSNNEKESYAIPTSEELMIPCRGTCASYYHLHCIKDPPRPEDYHTWKCSLCEYDKHLCGICGKEGVDLEEARRQRGLQVDSEVPTTKTYVVKCAMRNCPHFYHMKCVRHDPLTNTAHYTDQYKFRCPAHYCCVCSDTGNTKQLINCIWCGRSIHASCFTTSKGIRLSKKTYLCDRHKVPKGTQAWKPSNGKKKGTMKKENCREEEATAVESTPKKAVKTKKSTSRQKAGERGAAKKKRSSKVKYYEEDDEDDDDDDDEDEEIDLVEVLVPPKKETGKRRPTEPQKSVKKVKKEEAKPAPEDHPIGNKEQPVAIDRNLEYTMVNKVITYKVPYKDYKGVWCRYCGTRYSSRFQQGPHQQWLCVIHFILWKQKKIDLSKWKDKPILSPLHPEKNTHKKYETYVKSKK